MNQSLHLDRAILGWNPERLHQLLLDHVQCARSAAELLLFLCEARMGPEVSYCIIYPDVSEEPEAASEVAWRLRVVHDPASERGMRSPSRASAPPPARTARHATEPPVWPLVR